MCLSSGYCRLYVPALHVIRSEPNFDMIYVFDHKQRPSATHSTDGLLSDTTRRFHLKLYFELIFRKLLIFV